MTITTRRSLLLTLALCSASPFALAGEVDILTCIPKEKEAVGPADPIKCQTKDGAFDATLAKIYSEGWRIVDVEFFDGTREVIYLEKPVETAS